MDLLEEIKNRAGLNEMAMEDFRGPAGLEKAKSTISSVYKNMIAGKRMIKDFTAIIQSARKALMDDNALKNESYIKTANKVLQMIKEQKGKLGAQQARMDSK